MTEGGLSLTIQVKLDLQGRIAEIILIYCSIIPVEIEFC
jgi:hypothetical protein